MSKNKAISGNRNRFILNYIGLGRCEISALPD